MGKIIYADNAATTKLDLDAFEAMKPYLLEEYGNASQPYRFARQAKKALADARAVIAECIKAKPEEIYFTSGGTESDNWAIKGMMGDDHHRCAITSQIEHHAVLNACASVERSGIPVIYLPVNADGVVMPEILRKYMTGSVKVVSIMLVNNEIGTIEPIAQLASIAHEYGALFHTDAVQAIGHIPVDVNELQADMLSASGHKFNAPKGVGFLYVRKGTPLNAYADGGAQESGMRAGTENIASIVAMAEALKKNCSDMKETSSKLWRMEDAFIHTLKGAGIDFIHNGADNRVPGNINISIKGINGEMLLHRLDLKGIYISTGSACDSVNMRISHVIKAIGIPNDYAMGTVRISFGRDNDEEDAVLIAEAIIDIVNK